MTRRCPRGRNRCILRGLRRHPDRPGRARTTWPSTSPDSGWCVPERRGVERGRQRLRRTCGSTTSASARRRWAVTFDRPGADCSWAFPACGVGRVIPRASAGTAPAGATVSGAAGCGFPIGGCGQSLRIQGSGPIPVTPAAGGPIARPVAAPVNEVCVPLPAGSTDISFCWDFYTGKSSSASFNDGLSIDIVTAGGASLVPLVYADTFTPAGPCSWSGACGPAALERAPAGPQYLRRNFAPLPGGAYLSIACWNGGDNVASPSAAVDNIITGGSQLDYSSPGGAGSGTLALENLGFTPGDTVLHASRRSTAPASRMPGSSASTWGSWSFSARQRVIRGPACSTAAGIHASASAGIPPWHPGLRW